MARAAGRGTVVAAPLRPAAVASKPLDGGPAGFAVGRAGGVASVGSRLVGLGPNGAVSAVAGRADDQPGPGEVGDGGPLAAARFGVIRIVVADGRGDLYVVEETGSAGVLRIRFANQSSQSVTLYGGTPQARVVAGGAIETVATLSGSGEEGMVGVPSVGGVPVAAAVSGTRLYVATRPAGSSGSGRVSVQVLNLGERPFVAHGQQVAPAAVATVAGDVRWGAVSAVAADGVGNLFVAEPDEHRVRRVDHAGNVSRFAGSGWVGRRPDRAEVVAADRARLDRPVDVAVGGPLGRVYVLDEGHNLIRRIDLDGYARVDRSVVSPCRPADPGAARAAGPGEAAGPWRSSGSKASEGPGDEPDPLSLERSMHTATLLDPPTCQRSSPPKSYPCGQVLVVAGVNVPTLDPVPSNEAARYDPVRGRWRRTAPIPMERFAHTASLLGDGQVLVAGGEVADGPGIAGLKGTADSQLYDPAADRWRPTPTQMVNGRFAHTATVLDGGACRTGAPPGWCGKVLITGGAERAANRRSLDSVELYDPKTGTWTAGAPMATARQRHTATTLPDGRVLVVGGLGNRQVNAALGVKSEQGQMEGSAEAYDPATGTWTAAGSMSVARSFHTTTVLDAAECRGRRPPPWCGTVLVTGGLLAGGIEEPLQTGTATATTEVFDPNTGHGAGAWRPGPLLSTARQGHVAEQLFEGRVYVAGGDGQGTAEVYDPALDKWTPTRPLAQNRSNATATRLVGPRCRTSNPPAWCGAALVIGGLQEDPRLPGWRSLASVELSPPHNRPPPSP